MHNFNVMAQAHKHARKLIAKRPMPYRCALGAALVVCQMIGQYILAGFTVTTEEVE